jgi:hypothetical protein
MAQRGGIDELGAIEPFGIDESFIMPSSEVFIGAEGLPVVIVLLALMLFIVVDGERVVWAIAAVEIAIRATQPMVLSFMGLLPG